MHLAFISLFNNAPYQDFSVLYLFSMLKKYNYKGSLIFLMRKRTRQFRNELKILPTAEELEKVIEKLKFLKPDLVGISVYYTFFHSAVKLTEEIQRRLRIPVIWGGIYPSIAPDDCIQFADLICIGEGEEVVLDLAEYISAKKDINKIRNIWIRRNKTILKNDLRPALQNLDSLPFPCLDSKNSYYVSSNSVYNYESSKTEYGIMASRGCVFSCSYCSENIIRRIYNRSFMYRIRSPKNVILELAQAKNKSLRFIVFHDALFPYDSKWIREFSYLYKKEINLPFYVRSHFMKVKKENLDLLVDAGLCYIGFNIESGSERIRSKIFHRCGTNYDFLDTVKLFSQYKNLRMYSNIIVDNPFETLEDKMESLDFLLSVPYKFSLQLLPLIYFPKTDMTALAIKKGKIVFSDLLQATRTAAFSLSLKQKRNKEDKLWISLLILTILYKKLHCFPRNIIYLIKSSNFLRKNPEFLFIITYYIYWCYIFVERAYFKLNILLQKYRITKSIN